MRTVARAATVSLLTSLSTAALVVGATFAVTSGVPDLPGLAVLDVDVPRATPTVERLPTLAEVVAAVGDELMLCRRFDQSTMGFGGSSYRLHLLIPRRSVASVTRRLSRLTFVRTKTTLPFQALDTAPYGFDRGPQPCA